MKKLISILLVMMMILCMGTAAFADDTPTTNITINDADGRTYSGYQLLTLTSSHKISVNCGGNHTSACYNYFYTVNEKYREILQNEAFADTEEVFWGKNGNPTKPTGAGKVTDAQILAYLDSLTGDNEVAEPYGTLRDAADRIYRVIKNPDTTPTISPDVTLDYREDAAKTVEQGYWLIADITGLNGDEEANSLVMVNTKGLENLTITPKTALPHFEKKVRDIKDSEDANGFTDNAWADSADHDKKDTVPFKLTATVPDVTGYETYKMVFHDEMGTGLTLKPESVKVYMYDTTDAANTDINMESGSEVTGALLKADSTEDGCSFELTLTDVLDITGVKAGTAFVVYYEATLSDSPEFSSTDNTAYLEFSNNPYDDTKTGQTAKDTVKVYTYKLTINKVDAEGKPLTGAGFILFKKNAKGEYVAVDEELKCDEMTTFVWKGLDDGEYKLVENTVPAGFNKMEDKEFTISAEHDVDKTTLTSTLGTVADGTITDKVTNLTGTILPSTGAQGTMMLIGGGSVLIVLAAVFMITRKKMSVYED